MLRLDFTSLKNGDLQKVNEDDLLVSYDFNILDPNAEAEKDGCGQQSRQRIILKKI